MKKDAKATKKLNEAISNLASCYEYGELEASVDPAGLLNKAAEEIRALRLAKASPGEKK